MDDLQLAPPLLWTILRAVPGESPALRACRARRVCRAARLEFRDAPAGVRLQDPDLPAWAVREAWQGMRSAEARQRLLQAVAAGGVLAHVRMLREELGCEWSAGACEAAAARGRLDVLEWLRAAGCPWDGDACARAALRASHMDAARWALRGCGLDDEDTDAFVWDYMCGRLHEVIAAQPA